MTNTNTTETLTVNRTFKSTVFIMLFEDRKNLLELYNAMSGKHYTDPELLELTGGIVQGMSGSPVIQNGKFAGAVTHVFVQDSTSGYGIFAETMLENMTD